MGRMTRFFVFIAALLICAPAFAQETVKGPVTYSPEYCEFAVTFPEEPHSQRRCEDDSEEKCYDLISYTQVHEMSSTVSVRVICNPATEELFEKYSGEVMEATVKAMTEKTVVKTFDTSFREEEGYKQAGLVGEGKVGVTPTIYIAQLWIGKKSILSVEAEMTGEASEESDKLFSSILQSVHYSLNDPKPEESKPEEKSE
jgi:hypothetical protein